MRDFVYLSSGKAKEWQKWIEEHWANSDDLSYRDKYRLQIEPVRRLIRIECRGQRDFLRKDIIERYYQGFLERMYESMESAAADQAYDLSRGN